MTLFDRVFSGNDAVFGLTEGAIDGAIAQYGEDKAVSFPEYRIQPSMLLRCNRNKSYNFKRIKRSNRKGKYLYN